MRTVTSCVALSVLLGGSAAMLFGRTWTDKSGKEIEAELVEVKGKIAILQKPDGKILKMPVAKLSDEDVAFLKEEAAVVPAKPKAAPGKTANKSPAKPKKIPAGKIDDTANAPDADKPGAATVEVAVLNIMNPKFQQQTFLGDPGIYLTLWMSLAGKQIATLDEENCSITSCTDDTGRDLTKHPKGYPQSEPFRLDSAKGEGAAISTHLPLTPAAGATKIHLTGKLTLKCAGGEKSDEQAGVSTKAPSEIKVGAIQLKVEPFGAQVEPESQTITVSSDTPASRIKKFVFLDADGKEIRQRLQAWADGSGFEKSFVLWTAADKITVRLITFDKTETINVPIELKIGVGF